jgi:hypothetical protein
VSTIARRVLTTASSKLTYANVVATFTLVLVLGGATAYAASGGPGRTGDSSTPTQVRLCAVKQTGDLRLLTRGSCTKNERPLTLSAQGPAGPAGAQGPKGEQGPRGERGPSGTVTSPDGRFSVTATDQGIVLAGPSGALTFDGTQLSTGSSLAISTGAGLTVQSGTGLSVSSGSTLALVSTLSTSITSGTTMTQQAGGSFEQTAGASYSQTVGNNYVQSVGNNYSQTVGGSLVSSIAKSLTQTVTTALSMQSGTQATLSGATVSLGGSSSCVPAARVGSLVDGTLHVTTTGSSAKVLVC